MRLPLQNGRGEKKQNTQKKKPIFVTKKIKKKFFSQLRKIINTEIKQSFKKYDNIKKKRLSTS